MITQLKRWLSLNTRSLLVLSFFLILYTYKLGKEGMGYPVYTASAITGSNNLDLLLRHGMDPNGFISYGKPFLALLPVSLAIKLFGINSYSLILPEICLVLASAWVVATITKIWVPKLPRDLSMVIYLSTPVVFVVARSNMPDALLIFLTSLALLLFSRWVKSNSVKSFLYLNLLFILIIFTKLGAIYLIAPAFLLGVFLAQRGGFKKKFFATSLLMLNLTLIPLLWAFLYSYLPGRVPFVGATGTGSPITLAYYSEGFGRVLGIIPNFLHNLPIMPSAMAFPSYQNAGIFKLLKSPYIEQFGWLLPLTFFGLLSILISLRKTFKKDRVFAYIQIVNAVWFLGVFFGIGIAGAPACCTHPYYSVMLVIPQTFILCNFLVYARKIVWIFSIISTFIFQFLLLKGFPVINTTTLSRVFVALFILVFIIIFLKSLRAKYVILLTLVFLPLSMIFYTVTTYPLAMRHGDPLAGSFAILQEQHGLKEAKLNSEVGLSMVGESSARAEGVELALSDKLKSLPNYYWGSATLREYIAATLQLTTNRPVLAFGGELGAESPISLIELKELINAKKLCYFVIDSRDIYMLNKSNSLSPWSEQAYLIMEFLLTKGEIIEYNNKFGPVIMNLCK